MKDKNALAVANYLLKIAKEKGEQLQLLKLMKLVYIAHGFGLAMLENNRSMIDSRFDKVEKSLTLLHTSTTKHLFKAY